MVVGRVVVVVVVGRVGVRRRGQTIRLPCRWHPRGTRGARRVVVVVDVPAVLLAVGLPGADAKASLAGMNVNKAMPTSTKLEIPPPTAVRILDVA